MDVKGQLMKMGYRLLKKTPQATRVTFGLQMPNIGYKSGYNLIA